MNNLFKGCIMVEFGRAGHAHSDHSHVTKTEGANEAYVRDEFIRESASILVKESVELVEIQKAYSLCAT